MIPPSLRHTHTHTHTHAARCGLTAETLTRQSLKKPVWRHVQREAARLAPSRILAHPMRCPDCEFPPHTLQPVASCVQPRPPRQSAPPTLVFRSPRSRRHLSRLVAALCCCCSCGCRCCRCRMLQDGLSLSLSLSLSVI